MIGGEIKIKYDNVMFPVSKKNVCFILNFFHNILTYRMDGRRLEIYFLTMAIPAGKS